MGRLYNSVTELVGKTPLLRLHNYAKEIGVTATLAVKLEAFNPAGSAKDRIALQMIKDAEADGRLRRQGEGACAELPRQHADGTV